MEASDSEDEIVDLNEAQTNSKTIIKKENHSKSSLKKVRWSKTQFSVDSISQIVKSEIDQSYDEVEIDNEKENNDNEKLKENEDDNIADNNNNKNETKTSNTSFIYTFIWEEGGTSVKLIGSFSDWKNSFDMKRDINDNIYKISLPLNNEIYYYKFIVDGEWKYSKNQQIKQDDQGNINNILDLTTFFMNVNPDPIPSTTNENDNSNNKKNKKKKSSKLSNKKKTKKIKKAKIQFGTENINRNQMSEPHNNDVIGIPFNINNESKQNNLGNKKYYDFEQRNFFSSEKSYLRIQSCRHNLIQHIFLPTINESYEIKIGFTQRYRGKATTIIYYKSSSETKN